MIESDQLVVRLAETGVGVGGRKGVKEDGSRQINDNNNEILIKREPPINSRARRAVQK